MSLHTFPSAAIQRSAEQTKQASLRKVALRKVKPLLKILYAEGIALETLLDDTGICLSDLTRYDFSISYGQYHRLIENACRLASHSDFALRLGEQFYINQDSILACRIMSCDSALQAMYLLRDYQCLLTRIFHLEFEVGEKYGVMTVHPNTNLRGTLPFFIEYTFAAIYSLGKFCIGREQLDLRYEFAYSIEPREPAVYHRFFGEHVRFDAVKNRVLIPLETLHSPFIFAHAGNARINDRICQSKVRKIRNETDICKQVIKLLRRRQFQDVSVDAIAKELCMSTRTLRRQLQAQKLSYKTLLEQERRKLARSSLQNNPGMSVEQLAEQLGYQDVSSFSRAFKRWFGQAPSHFKS